MNSGDEVVRLAHGSGGRLSHELFSRHFQPVFDNPALNEQLDCGVQGDLALTTDAYVVTPRFFPGGDLGRLCVCGTINDLAMVGARPLALTAAFILEEGLPLGELDAIVASMAAAAREVGVCVVAGDTKVVPHGACDGIFITTSGVGRMDPTFQPHPRRVLVGDAIIVSGTIGDHGMAVMASRPGMRFAKPPQSDVAPLVGLVDALRDAAVQVHALRDPTRGGLAQSLIEIAQAAQVRMELYESAIPMKPEVVAACELLGIDALYVANEGKLVGVVPQAQAAAAVTLLRALPLGEDAAVIGAVVDKASAPGTAEVELCTTAGGRRALRMAGGELLPRIC